MSISIEIQKKTNIERKDIVKGSEDVVNLKEIQEIKNAIQEYMFLICLDRGNHIRNISLIGVGVSNAIYIHTKDIIRTAILTASDRVILVHNHPSNTLKPSKADKEMTNITSKLLKAFDIELLDHIIVTEDSYVSLKKIKQIDKNYENDSINLLSKVLLIEENNKLKEEIKALKEKIYNKEDKTEEAEEL